MRPQTSGWRPMKSLPVPKGMWDGKTFVALRYKKRYWGDSGQIEAVTIVRAHNIYRHGEDGDRKPIGWKPL